MFLREVRIQNFRSIRSQTLSFNKDNRCRILVGINESGKSNILRALSMLSPDVEPLKEDVREPSPEEGAVKESFIRFVFELDSEEASKVYHQVSLRMLTKAVDPDLFVRNRGDETLNEFCEAHRRGLYRVNLIKGTKEAVYFVLEEGYLVRSRWKKVSSNATSSEKKITLHDGREVDLDEYLLVDIESYPEISAEILEDVDANYVYVAIGTEINRVVRESLQHVSTGLTVRRTCCRPGLPFLRSFKIQAPVFHSKTCSHLPESPRLLMQSVRPRGIRLMD